MIKEIEKCDFLNKQKNKLFTTCVFGEKIEDKRYFYEIEILPNVIVGAYSNGMSKPQMVLWLQKSVLLLDNSVFIFDTAGEILYSKTFLAPVYEAKVINDLLFVFAEIDILVLEKDFSEVYTVRLNDVLTDYQIVDNLLEYQTMDGKRYQHKVVK